MKVQNFEQITEKDVDMEGASGCKVRWLIDEQDGAPNFAMRRFEVAAGGHTPKHHHPYEHEVYVLEGSGVVLEGDRQRPLEAGDVVYVAPDEVHQFRNTGSAPLKFLCLVPNTPQVAATQVTPECGRD